METLWELERTTIVTIQQKTKNLVDLDPLLRNGGFNFFSKRAT